MQLIFKIFLVLHIIGGSLSLLSGLLVVLSKKGNQRHRKLGRVFYYSMLLTTSSSLLLAVIKSGLFLFCIGIFSFYQTYMGYRAIKNKELRAGTADKLVWSMAVINSLVMIATINPVLMVFGGIGVANTLRQFIQQRQLKGSPAPAGEWLQLHIGMIMGAFIATVTAFIVVNAPDNLGTVYAVLLWLTPTILLVPLIVFWSIKYKKRATPSPQI